VAGWPAASAAAGCSRCDGQESVPPSFGSSLSLPPSLPPKLPADVSDCTRSLSLPLSLSLSLSLSLARSLAHMYVCMHACTCVHVHRPSLPSSSSLARSLSLTCSKAGRLLILTKACVRALFACGLRILGAWEIVAAGTWSHSLRRPHFILRPRNSACILEIVYSVCQEIVGSPEHSSEC
jgi:hypothetical protein